MEAPPPKKPDLLGSYFAELTSDTGFSIATDIAQNFSPDTPVASLRRDVDIAKLSPEVIQVVMGALRVLVAWRERRVIVPAGLLEASWQSEGAPHLDRFCRGLHALLLSLNGHIALHGNVVQTAPGVAVALLGPSGAGKSTLAYSLNHSGMPALSDDLCSFDPHTLRISYYARFMQLRSPSCKLFGLQPGKAVEKRLVSLAPIGAPHTLEQIYFLRPHTGEGASASPVDTARGCFLMMKHTLVDPQMWGVTMPDYFSKCIEAVRRIQLQLLAYSKTTTALAKTALLVQSGALRKGA